MAAAHPTTPAIESFLEDLNHCTIDGTRGSASAQFVTHTRLRACLALHISDLLQDVAPDQLHRENDILNQHARVFTILIIIREGGFISHFLSRELLSDRRLPFIDKDAFPHAKDFFDKFWQRQYMFCTPVFTRHLEWNFDQYRILPFDRERESIASGNSGDIYKIRFPQEYDAMDGSPLTDEVTRCHLY